MKRFGFDWENNRALKFDDYFKFPFVLDMEPYTLDGVNNRESFVEHNDSLMMNTSGNLMNGISIDSSSTTIGNIILNFIGRQNSELDV